MLAELQLANAWSLKTDLDRAMTSAQACEQSARQINERKLEALSVSVQGLICGIRSDRDGTEAAAERAESIAPGDPEVLFTTWGQARVTASLFWDDIDRALDECIAGRACLGQAPLSAPRRAWGYYAVLQAVYGLDGRGAIEQAREAGAGIGWIQGLLAYAEAVLEGRDGHQARATALADEGMARLLPFAPWWNHLVRRLVATSALEDGWGQP